MNLDFVEMLSALSAARADFLVVGAHAMAAHGYPRATGDIDIWVRPTTDNAARVFEALAAFGAPLADLKRSDLETEGLVFQIGVPPVRIDLLTSIDGVRWEEAWSGRIEVALGDLVVPVLGREQLLTNKRATGRARDLADVAWLEEDAGD